LKLPSFSWNSSTNGGRKMALPSVEGASFSTQPIPFSASDSDECTATS
jgi:hypothetical protein